MGGQQKHPDPCRSDLDHPQEYPKFMRSIDRTRPPHNKSHIPYCLPLLPDKILNTKDPNPIWVHVRYEATGRFGQARVFGLGFQTQQPPSGTTCLAQAWFPMLNCPGRTRACKHSIACGRRCTMLWPTQINMGCSRRGHALVGPDLNTTPRSTPNPSTDLRVNQTTKRGSSGGPTGARTSTPQKGRLH